MADNKAQEQTKPNNRLAYLDSIRGIAALMVAYLHYSQDLIRNEVVIKGELEYGIMHFLTKVVDLGKVGVIVFFAVSGFVIPFSLLKGRAKPLRHFLVSRLFRLYPAYWLSIPFGVVFYWMLEDKSIDITTIALNFTMFQQFLLQPNIMGLYWTLQIELIFYILCAALFFIKWLDKPKMLFLVALGFLGVSVAAAYIRHEMGIKIPVALSLALMFMFWGAIWREYIVHNDQLCKKLGLIIIALFIPAMPIIGLLAYNQDMGFGETWYRYTISYYTAMSLILILTTVLKLQNRFFSWLGRISYSVYLFHSVVFKMVIALIGYQFLIDNNIPAHVFMAAVAILAMGAAHIIYTFVEAPAVKLGRHINNKMGNGASGPIAERL